MNDTLITAEAVPVTNSDLLRVVVWAPVAESAEIDFILRTTQVDPKGELIYGLELFSVWSDLSPKTLDIPLTTGKLIGVSCFTTNTSVVPGLAYAQFSIIRGSFTSSSSLEPISSGGISFGNQLNYPKSDTVDVSAIVGGVVNIQPADPAAGNPITVNFQTNYITEVLQASWFFATSATIANRIPSITLTDDLSGSSTFYANDDTAESLTRQVTTFAGGSPVVPIGPSGPAIIPVPNRMLVRGGNLSLSAFLLQAGDTLAGASLYYRQTLLI